MIFSFLKPRQSPIKHTPLIEIETMLDQTWNLSKQFEAKPDEFYTDAVTLFNGFFSKLNGIITRILKSVVQLSSSAPKLFKFVKAFRNNCIEQEKKVTAIARAGEAMAHRSQEMAERIDSLTTDSVEINRQVSNAGSLGKKSMEQFTQISRLMDDFVQIINALDEDSKSIGSIINVLNTISDETNILSLNARIEAVNGNQGSKGFKVIAEEIAQLSKQSKNATADIKKRLTLLQGRVSETVNAAEKVHETVIAGGKYSLSAQDSLDIMNRHFESFTETLSRIRTFSQDQSHDVKTVSSDILEIEKAVRQQSVTVEDIVTIAEKINTLCETIIVDTGSFHLSGHKRAQQAAEAMAKDPQILSMDRGLQETRLNDFLDQFLFIELAYITDPTGKQTVQNIYSSKVADREILEKGFGRDWSEKPWFLNPVETGSAYLSNTYRSSATGRFCFTVSLPLTDPQGDIKGIIAIDINVEDMLNI